MRKAHFCNSLNWNINRWILLALLLLLSLKSRAQSQPGLPLSAPASPDSVLQQALKQSFDLAFDNPDKAMHYGRQALALARQLKKMEEEAEALENIGYIFYDQSALDSAELYFNRALHLSKISGHIKGQSNRLNALGQVYFRRLAFSKALNYYHQALQLLQQVKGAAPASGIYNNISLVYKSMGDFPRAIESLLKALQINEKAADKRRVALNLSNLGYLYKDMNNLPQARLALEKAVTIAREIDKKQPLVLGLINLGVVYTNMAEQGDTSFYHAGWQVLQEALTLSQRLKDKRSESIASHDLAQILIARNQITQSLPLAKYSFQIKQTLGDTVGLIHSYTQLASIAQAQGKVTQALQYAQNAVGLADNTAALPERKSALAKYADLLFKTNNSALAYAMLLRHQSVSDSLLDEQKARSITQAEFAYDTNKKQQAINGLEAEKQKQKQLNIYGTIIGGLILVAAGMFIGLQRKRLLLQEKERAIQQLKLDTAELTQFKLKKKLEKYTRDLINSNREILQLQESITRTTDNRTARKTELANLKVLREEDWVHFKDLFETVYPGFFTVLKTQYPALAANDIRLAALFRLGLNTREMASALGIEIESVKKARYRLRKKLGCDPEQDLTAYFIALNKK